MHPPSSVLSVAERWNSRRSIALISFSPPDRPFHHELYGVAHVHGKKLCVGMRARPDAEDLVCESLADEINTFEIENHLAELLDAVE